MLSLYAGRELSYLQPGEQEMLLKAMEAYSVFPNLARSAKMRKLSNEGRLNKTGMELVLTGTKPQQASIKLHRKKLNDYFPENYSSKQIEKVIYELLRQWSLEIKERSRADCPLLLFVFRKRIW